MKKIKQSALPTPPATDHPTGSREGVFVRSLFSLVDDPVSLFQHQPLFHSYDLAELKKELVRVEALEKEQMVPFDTSLLREQIRLIELLNTPANGPTLLKWEFDQAGVFQAELTYLIASLGNQDAFESFSRKTQEHFWHLKQLASYGHEGALRSLATMAIEATEVVNRHAVNQPEAFRTVATERTHWPFLKSLNRQLNQISTDDEDKLLRQLHSGEATQQDLTSDNRYAPENPATAVAQKLLDYVREIRNLSKFIYKDNLPAKPKMTDYLAWAGRLPDSAQGPKAAEMWWNLAKRFLLESYPALDPKTDADLIAIAPMLLKISKVANIKARRRRILYNLERAFMTILAKPPGTVRISS